MKRLLLVLGLAGAALVAPAGPASAAACPASSGVTVQVDFASLGGGTQVGCAAGDPSSGIAALQAAGFTPTRAVQQPGYFVCRINGKPPGDPCQRTSPADAYWSYWHGRPGGGWTYSSTGAADYHPTPGTVEGWAFGAGTPPSSPPAAPVAAAASPTPTAAPARTAAITPWSKGAAAPARVAASRSAASRSAEPAALPTATVGATPVAGAASSSASASPASPLVGPSAVAEPSSPSGPGLTGLAVAAGLVALLGGGALLQRRRRSRP